MIFTMNMKVEQWYLQDVNFKFTPSHTCFNYSQKSINSHVMIPLILLVDMTFLWHLRTSRLKKVLPQRENTSLIPKWAFLTWAQIVACEVDGPSLQPSTWHLYTHLMLPIWIQRGCMWAGMASSEAERAAGEAGPVAWPAASETSGPVDSWGGGWEIVMLGAWWGFLERGRDRRGWECDVTPLKSP